MTDERKNLVDGFERFRQKYYESGDKLMRKLVKDGAKPDFFIINCIDPRSGADTIFDSPPGTLFEDSQMAAIVPPDEPGKTRELKAALKYAIEVMKVKHVIIKGHTHCGGCQALVDDKGDPDIAPWVGVARQALERAKKNVGTHDEHALQRETEKQVVIQSLRNLLEYPVVKKAFQDGRITVSGWMFDMDSGALLEYDPNINGFKPLNIEDEKPASRKKFGTFGKRRDP